MKALVGTTGPSDLLPPGGGPGSIVSYVAPFLNTLRFVRERAENTLTAYGQDLTRFLEFCALGGLITPQDVRVKHIELYLAWLRQERKASKATAQRHLACLREFWRYLIREEVVTTSPASAAYGMRGTRRMPVYLKITEQEALLDELVKDHSIIGQRNYAIVGVMLFAGLRVSEVVNLTLADVDLEGSTLRVRHGKGDKDRELPIVPRLRGILRAYLTGGRGRLYGARTDPWFFLTSGGAHYRRPGEAILTRSVYNLISVKVSPIVGRRLHPHALRHSFASRLRENGAPIELIQEALGHSNIGTTMVYAHLSTTKRMQDLTKHLEG